jgi:hypothetical protein
LLLLLLLLSLDAEEVWRIPSPAIKTQKRDMIQVEKREA